MYVKEQHGARVRREREKGFEDQCKKLDSILDASGGIGMMVQCADSTPPLGWDGPFAPLPL